MTTQPLHLNTATRPDALYLVPDRVVPRLAYVPAGRTLHLVDIENLMGGPFAGEHALQSASAEYRRVAAVRPSDIVTVACNPALAFDAGDAWPEAELRVGPGPDGADRALLSRISDDRWVARRFDRVVIGSGDGIFANATGALKQWGVAVGVVSLKTSLAFPLRQCADFVWHLPEPESPEACA